MRIEPATTDDAGTLADQWVALAREQRAHDTHVLPDPNRNAVREELVRRTVTGEVLVAREDAPDSRGRGTDDDPGAKADPRTDADPGADADRSETEVGPRTDADRSGTDADRSGTESDPGAGADRPGVDGRADTAGDDGVLGFVSFGRETGGLESDADRGIVHNLYVVPWRRGEGIGAALLSAAERRLAESGADHVGLEAMASNEAARRFYRREGYEPHRVEFEKPLDRNEGDDGDRPVDPGEDHRAR